MGCVQLLLVVQDINQAETKHIDDVSSKRQQEEEEIAVIPPSDAVVHPRTMMVKILRGNIEAIKTLLCNQCPTPHYSVENIF